MVTIKFKKKLAHCLSHQFIAPYYFWNNKRFELLIVRAFLDPLTMKLTETAILARADNRPRHFERVIQCHTNKIIGTPLIVHIDGPRSDAEKDQVLR